MARPPNLVNTIASAVIAQLQTLNGADPFIVDLTATGAVFRGWDAAGRNTPCVGITIPDDEPEQRVTTSMVGQTRRVMVFGWPEPGADFGATEDACEDMRTDLRQVLNQTALSAALNTVQSGYGNGAIVRFVAVNREGDTEQAQTVAPVQIAFTVTLRVNDQTQNRD